MTVIQLSSFVELWLVPIIAANVAVHWYMVRALLQPPLTRHSDERDPPAPSKTA